MVDGARTEAEVWLIPCPRTLIRLVGASVEAYPAPGDNAMVVAKYENGQSVYEGNCGALRKFLVMTY